MSDTDAPARAELLRTGDGTTVRFAVMGDWRIETVATLSPQVDAAAHEGPTHAVIDLTRAGRVDTSGAWLLYRLARSLAENGAKVEWTGTTSNARRLLEAVSAEAADPLTRPPRANAFLRFFDWIGGRVVAAGQDFARWTEILGGVVTGFARGVLQPRRLRVTSIVHHIDYTGIRAIPINLVIGFLIGVIIAQQGAFQFSLYVPGPDALVVDLVAFLVLREIGVLLAAIMMAGRSGSAFTAEIGSMKMREEIDALKVIGLNPHQILVMPRVLALMVSLPALTFLLCMAGILGGSVVCYFYLGMPFDVFFERLVVTRTENLFAGLIKAVFMAVAIGVISSAEGFKVAGGSDSLGRHTTSAVVKSILMIIAIDGIFAIFFVQIGF